MIVVAEPGAVGLKSNMIQSWEWVPAMSPAKMDSRVLRALLPGLERKMAPRERS
jgi:hypothetical protein